MTAAALLLVAALGAPVVLLPVDAPDLTDAQQHDAAAALAKALPKGFEPAPPDPEAAAARLSAAGPACHADVACACEVLAVGSGVPLLSLRVRGSGPTWGADLRLVLSCAGVAEGRAARFLPAGIPALSRYLSEVVPGLMLGGPELPLPSPPTPGRRAEPSPAAPPPAPPPPPPPPPPQEWAAAIAARGNERFKAGDYRGAEAEFLRVLAQSPDDPILLYNLGQTYVRLGDKGEARRFLGRFLDSPPREGDEKLRREAQRRLTELER